MKRVKLEIFLNLKNYYELCLEIKDEKNPDLKSLKKTIAAGIYDHLNCLLIAYRDLFKKFFAQINDSKEKAQSYIANGNGQTGLSALEQMDLANNSLPSLLNSISDTTKVKFGGDKGARTQTALPEQKITSNFLKKLIEESFKK